MFLRQHEVNKNNQTKTKTKYESEDVMTNSKWIMLLKIIFKNIVVGPGLCNEISSGSYEFPIIWIWGQIAGVVGIYWMAHSGETSDLIEFSGFFFTVSTFVGLANFWGLPVGIIDRCYGIYKTVKDITVLRTLKTS